MPARRTLFVKAVVPGAAPVDIESSLVSSDEPTRAQAAAGRYPKRLMPWKGLTFRIENEAGSVRRGTKPDGSPWETRMFFPYGEIARTEGVDGDPVDVFIGPFAETADTVFVVHQRRVDDWRRFDEDKCMIGFLTEDDAKAAFLQCYDDPRFLGPITAMPVAEFVEKARATKEKPKMIKAAGVVPILFLKAKDRRDTHTQDMFASPGTHMETITRKDGVVQRHVVANAKKDAALTAAVDHLKEDAKQSNLPAAEKKEDAALVAKLEEAKGDNLPTGLFVRFAGKQYPVESFQDASEKWEKFRDETGEGVSGIGIGIPIFDGSGKQVANVSYNGKVWPGEDWKPGAKPLYMPGGEAVNTEGSRVKLSKEDIMNHSAYGGMFVEDEGGNRFRIHSARQDYAVAHPVVDGMAQVSADTAVKFHLNPDTAAGYPERNHSQLYRQLSPSERGEKFSVPTFGLANLPLAKSLPAPLVTSVRRIS